MKHILIIGLENTYNLGDPLLLNCAGRELEKSLPGAEVKIANITGNFTMKKYLVPSYQELNRQSRKSRTAQMLSRYTPYDRLYISAQHALQWEFDHGLRDVLAGIRHKDIDLVVFAGGQMFMRSFILPMQQIVKKCEEERIPVIFHACGFGPVGSRHLQKILENTLLTSCVSSVTVRDNPSEREFAQYPDNLRKKIHFSADMGLWASEVYPFSGTNSGVVGLGVVYTDAVSMKKEIEFFTSLIRLLEQKNISWQLFTNGHPSDECIAGIILQKATLQSQSKTDYRILVPRTPAQLAETVASFDSIISCRLHSHILAASFNVPSVAIVWDRKVQQFFQTAGVPDRCLTFDSSPKMVLDTLLRAREQKWDQPRIRSMREKSLETLLQQIEGMC